MIQMLNVDDVMTLFSLVGAGVVAAIYFYVVKRRGKADEKNRQG